MKFSQSPVVAEFEYMLPLCSEKAFGMTTISSLNPWAAASRSALRELGEPGR